MYKCKCCGAEIPDGVCECPNCKVYQEPPAKYKQGDVVKITLKDRGYIYYNHIVDSYYNHEIDKRLYRLNERMAMPVYCEDWLEPVSGEEIDRVNKSGLLRPGGIGGWEYPLTEEV